MRGSRIAVGMLAAVVLVGFAGCGDDGDDSDDGAGAASFCDRAERVVEEGVFAALGQADPTTEEGRAQYQDALDEFEQLEEVAPQELRDDLAKMKEPVAVLAEGDVERLSELSSDEEFTAEVNEANAEVNEYLRDECGLGASPDTDEPTDGTGTTETTETNGTTGTTGTVPSTTPTTRP